MKDQSKNENVLNSKIIDQKTEIKAFYNPNSLLSANICHPKLRVVELFAGVGGFRVGLEHYNKDAFETVFFNQWEPAKKRQSAYDCYLYNFGLNNIREDLIKYTNLDIRLVPKNELPDFDILVAGFPCQNYSVAAPKSSKGIEGPKGVLWWDIRSTLEEKNPPFILLENVDRLLRSPSNQKGRDFGIILKCLDELDYNVQWRIINAAEYGKPQKRRRTYIFAYKRYLNYAKDNSDFFNVMFPAKLAGLNSTESIRNLSFSEISKSFCYDFKKSGKMIDGIITTQDVISIPVSNTRTLGSVLIPAPNNSYDITNEAPWITAKGAKNKNRIARNGHAYTFTEGKCPYPDNLTIPARTTITSEGSVNRCSHVVIDPVSGNKRRLLPIEAERIQTFPDNWTQHGLRILENGQEIITTLSDRDRYFLIGNALVTELITDMAPELLRIYQNELSNLLSN